MNTTSSTRCPCGSGLVLEHCCGLLHQGENAGSPEALMRSRFAAFALGLEDYLRHSWHPDSCPAQLGGDDDTRWKRLEILDSGETGDQGWVQFRATFAEGPPGRQRWGVLEERSRFVRHQGRWVYLDGEARVSRLKPGRNDPCPCGSARKFKQCCA